MSANQRPGFWRRLWRAFWIFLFTVVIVAALGVGGYLGYRELNRVYSGVLVRMDALEQTVSLIRSDVNTLMGEDPEQLQQTATMGADISRLDIQVDNLENALDAEMTQQQGDLEVLKAEVETAVGTIETLSADVTTLNVALTALQNDITENGSQIDALGGQIDGTQAIITELDGTVTTLADQQSSLLSDAAAAPDIQRTLSLFRVWELITRARLRLLESNAGLASNDVETAIRTVDLLVALEPETESLQAVQSRLVLAFGNLPDAPVLAAADLEAAWDELDAILGAVLLGGETADSDTGNVETVTIDPTPTPDTAAQEATPSPTVAVTPTNQPEETPEPTPTP